MMKRQLLAASAAFFFSTAAIAGNDVSSLKGIDSVMYMLQWEQQFEEGICDVDWKTWRENTKYLVDQIGDLHLIDEFTHNDEMTRLSNAVSKKDPLGGQWGDAFDKMRLYTKMPWLIIGITVAPVGKDCIARLDAEVRVWAKSAETESGYKMFNPQIKVWSKTSWLRGPPDHFNFHLLSMADDLMKNFINMWRNVRYQK